MLAANRERDRILGYTSTGIHKDELEMTLNGHLIRRVGSQGQNKTYLIALKLAQYVFLSCRGQARPILLLTIFSTSWMPTGWSRSSSW